ncbi:MAG TPA: S9 family peptidase [Candidatus Nanoarchaeia archaeon]|nr:S9 family peptidase [Candidatus Nanoarchaeia archaeon]
MSASTETKLIPREVLFGNPEKAMARISPDGKRISYLAPVNNVLNVFVGSVDKNDAKPVTKDTDRGIRSYFWAKDSKHIMYVQDKGGDENWRLYSVNLETKDTRDLTPFDKVQVRILDVNKRFPDDILIEMNKDDEKIHDAYHLHLPTGEIKLVAKNPGNFIGWQTDFNMKIRGAMAATPGGGFDFFIRDSEKADWKKIISWGDEDSLNSGPVDFTKDGKSVYLMDSRNVNASRLVKMNLPAGDTEVLASDENYDVSGVMINPDTHEIEMVTFVKDRDVDIILDKTIESDIEAIKKLHHGDFILVSRNNADDVWLVAFDCDDKATPYYYYDRKTKSARFLFYNMPRVNEYALAHMEPIEFKSRDGFDIHGYITFPPGKERKNLPMVVDVHGGPWTRDTWGFVSDTQWFANRGYISLQINYRGSTGYGKNFLNAGNKEWGGKMHDDLIDGVNFVVKKGYANPKKIAIFGGSYGGYAALVGATFTPDVFACAVDIVGPSNLVTMMKTIPPYWENYKEMEKKRIGDVETEEEFLKSRSPLFKVDKIKIPILIAQGKNDPRVKQSESEQIVEAMKKKNIPYEYMLFEDEGHGFAKPQNRIKFYAAAEKFLAKHLGGRFEE